MDSVDIKILKCLKKNARVNASVISDHVNMSVSAVIERIKKLEQNGVIKQFTIITDNQKIGKDIIALISISIDNPRHNEDFIKAVKGNPQVVECHYITGDFDFMLKVLAASTQDLEHLLFELKSLKGVSVTRTLVVLSTIKHDLCALPDDTPTNA